jgi:hypothetical protein
MGGIPREDKKCPMSEASLKRRQQGFMSSVCKVTHALGED